MQRDVELFVNLFLFIIKMLALRVVRPLGRHVRFVLPASSASHCIEERQEELILSFQKSGQELI